VVAVLLMLTDLWHGTAAAADLPSLQNMMRVVVFALSAMPFWKAVVCNPLASPPARLGDESIMHATLWCVTVARPLLGPCPRAQGPVQGQIADRSRKGGSLRVGMLVADLQAPGRGAMKRHLQKWCAAVPLSHL